MLEELWTARLMQYGLEECEKTLKEGGDQYLENFLKEVEEEQIRIKKLEEEANQILCTVEGCNRPFKTYGLRAEHIYRVHSPSIPCPYESCDHQVKLANIQRHMKSYHEKVVCRYCKQFVIKNKINQHLMSNCPKSWRLDEFGDIKYKSDEVKDKENREDKNAVKKFPCTKEGCARVFKSLLDKTEHILKVHMSPIRCPLKECNTYVKPANLLAHTKARHSKPKKGWSDSSDSSDSSV